MLPATVADAIEHAGVSRKTFYEHSRDKEARFLAAYDSGVEILLHTMREAGGTRARVRAYLELPALEDPLVRVNEALLQSSNSSA